MEKATRKPYPWFNVQLTADLTLISGNSTYRFVYSYLASSVSFDVSMFGDLNGDNKVDIKDIAQAAVAFGSYPNHPRWNSRADLN